MATSAKKVKKRLTSEQRKMKFRGPICSCSGEHSIWMQSKFGKNWIHWCSNCRRTLSKNARVPNPETALLYYTGKTIAETEKEKKKATVNPVGYYDGHNHAAHTVKERFPDED